MDKELALWTLSSLDILPSKFSPPYDIRRKVENTKSIPLLSNTCNDLILLAGDEYPDMDKLIDVIEKDPFLCIQLIRTAKSAFFNYPGKVDTVSDAIVRVLGLDRTFNIALGLSATKCITCRFNGLIGLKAYWHNAIASVNTLKIINGYCGADSKQNNIDLYLAGLFYDIGYPLLGEFFPPEHAKLESIMERNGFINTIVLENFVLGLDHGQIGAWLSCSWGLPETVSNIMVHHHNPHYKGADWKLNLMTYLVYTMLSNLKPEYQPYKEVPEYLFNAIGIYGTDIEQIKYEAKKASYTTKMVADLIFNQ